MPPLVIPNTVQAVWTWVLDNTDYAQNVLHYLVPGTVNVTQATANTYAGAITTQWGASIIHDRIATNVQLDRISVRDLRTPNQPAFEDVVNLAGTDPGQALPKGVSIVTTLRTALAGRSFRGRVYLPGWSENANDADANPGSVARGRAEAFIATQMNLLVQPDTWNLAVASRTLLQSTVVQDVIVRDAVWDTQRRRNYPGI